MKILFQSNSSQIGGGNRSLLSTVYGLKNHGVKTVVYMPGEGPLADELQRLKIEKRIVPSTKALLSQSPMGIYSFVRFALNVFRDKANVIHANDLMCYRPIGMIGRALKKKTVCHFRFSTQRDSVKYFLRPFPDVCIFNSRYMLEEFYENNPCLVDRKFQCYVIYNPFDVSMYRSTRCVARELRYKYGWAGHTVIGLVGNYQKVKGHEIFFEMAANLIRCCRKRRFVFAVIGDDIFEGGKRREELQSLARELGISEFVQFLGFRSDVAEIMASLDVLVVPSKYEPFGRVAVEGLLAGVPVVAARVGGLVEILRGNPLGFLVDDLTPQAFAGKTMSALCFKENATRAEIQLGVKTAEERFGAERCLRELLAIYRSLGQ